MKIKSTDDFLWKKTPTLLFCDVHMKTFQLITFCGFSAVIKFCDFISHLISRETIRHKRVIMII